MISKVALIPARKGSERLPGKNIADLNGHPLIAYTISSAKRSKLFDRVIVSTDCPQIAEISRKYGAEVPSLRSSELSSSSSPDIFWVLLAINDWLQLKDEDFLAILRPTNPFRTPATIIQAFNSLLRDPSIDSIRAIRPIKEHPSKMWKGGPGKILTPFDDSVSLETGAPHHSSPFQSLEKLWIQDASLEIARVSAVRKHNSISGLRVLGFEMPKNEGFDINYGEDLVIARKIALDNEIRI